MYPLSHFQSACVICSTWIQQGCAVLSDGVNVGVRISPLGLDLLATWESSIGISSVNMKLLETEPVLSRVSPCFCTLDKCQPLKGNPKEAQPICDPKVVWPHLFQGSGTACKCLLSNRAPSCVELVTAVPTQQEPLLLVRGINIAHFAHLAGTLLSGG